MPEWLDGFKVVERRCFGNFYSAIVTKPDSIVLYIPGQPVRRRDKRQGPLAVFVTHQAARQFIKYTGYFCILVILPCKYLQSKQRSLWSTTPFGKRLTVSDVSIPNGTDFANVVIVEDKPIN